MIGGGPFWEPPPTGSLRPLVSRILFPSILSNRPETTIHLGSRLPGTSSDLPADVFRPFGRDAPRSQGAGPADESAGALSAYLVLLPVGFAVPRVSPRARCALTAPFHPCRPTAEPWAWAVSFCCTFRRIAPPGRYPAPCPGTRRLLGGTRSSDFPHPGCPGRGRRGSRNTLNYTPSGAMLFAAI